MRRLIIGCGYLGGRVARAWVAQSDEVWALTRSEDNAARFEQEGIRPLSGDVLNRDSLTLPKVDTVLYAVGYDRSSPASKQAVYVDGLRNVLNRLPEGCGRLIYVSSTSVYGQHDGEWVDEGSDCVPSSEGGRICLDAEHLARNATCGCEVTIVRLSGIYGPGRLAARVDALRRQQPIAAHPHGWLNLIHVDDACTAVLRCAETADNIETLLVSDDRPQRRREYYERLTSAIAAPPPVFASADDHNIGKRCRNDRLHQLLIGGLQFPTFTDGLPSALSGAS